MTLSQSDCYPWTYYIFFVNNNGNWELLHHYFSKFTFQQEGAPAHRASETVQMTPDFIPPRLWPPSSPDLNPVDYAQCGRLCRSLQEEDQGCWWTASADCGGMGTTRPACDWQCDQTVAQETARLCRCRRWTVWTFSVTDILTTTMGIILLLLLLVPWFKNRRGQLWDSSTSCMVWRLL